MHAADLDFFSVHTTVAALVVFGGSIGRSSARPLHLLSCELATSTLLLPEVEGTCHHTHTHLHYSIRIEACRYLHFSTDPHHCILYVVSFSVLHLPSSKIRIISSTASGLSGARRTSSLSSNPKPSSGNISDVRG